MAFGKTNNVTLGLQADAAATKKLKALIKPTSTPGAAKTDPGLNARKN